MQDAHKAPVATSEREASTLERVRPLFETPRGNLTWVNSGRRAQHRSQRRFIGMGRDDSEPAASRTELAEDRTVLANERTFAGWMRTSLASVAIGVGFHALFPAMSPSWVPRAIATAFLLLAVVIIVMAERRAAAVMDRLSAHIVVTVKPMNLRTLAGAIAAGAIALICAIWLASPA